MTLTDVLREVIRPEAPHHNFVRLPDTLPEEDGEVKGGSRCGLALC